MPAPYHAPPVFEYDPGWGSASEDPPTPAPTGPPLGERLVRGAGGFFATLLFLFGLWAFLLGMVWTGVGALILALGVRHLGRGNRATRTVRNLVIGVELVLFGVYGWLPFHELHHSLGALEVRLARDGVEGLDLRDRCALFGLQGLLSGGAVVLGLPHAGREMVSMVLARPKVRYRESDFALRSPLVRDTIRSWLTDLRSHPREQQVELSPIALQWTPRQGVNEQLPIPFPAASALTLSGEAEREGSTWRLFLSGRAEIGWDPDVRVPLAHDVRGRDVTLSLALLHALEQAGWLHGYTAEWSWIMSAEDPRLQADPLADPTTSGHPLAEPWERGAVAVVGWLRRGSERVWGDP